MSIDMRLRGTKAELEQLTKGWIDKPEVLSISAFYADRGQTKLGRIYVKIEPALQILNAEIVQKRRKRNVNKCKTIEIHTESITERAQTRHTLGIN